MFELIFAYDFFVLTFSIKSRLNNARYNGINFLLLLLLSNEYNRIYHECVEYTQRRNEKKNLDCNLVFRFVENMCNKKKNKIQ